MTCGYPPPERSADFRANSTDIRGRNFGGDLSPLGDMIVNSSSVTVVITRRDGLPTTGDDLQVVGPIMLDITHLIVTFALLAPVLSVGVDYDVAITVLTVQGRNLTYDFFQFVASALG